MWVVKKLGAKNTTNAITGYLVGDDLPFQRIEGVTPDFKLGSKIQLDAAEDKELLNQCLSETQFTVDRLYREVISAESIEIDKKLTSVFGSHSTVHSSYFNNDSVVEKISQAIAKTYYKGL